MTRHYHAALRVLLLAAIAVPAFAGHRIAASSPLPPLPVPTMLAHPRLLPHPSSLPDRAIFVRASARSGVPVSLLLALSYVQSFWGDHGGHPSIDGGYGLLGLTHNAERDTLDAAAHLAAVPARRVMRDDALNVLGGALLLAQAARALSPRHRLPSALGDWAGAVVWFTGMRTRLAAAVVVRGVYGLLAHGMQRRGLRGRLLGIVPSPGAAPNMRAVAAALPRAAATPHAAVAEYPAAQWAPSPNYNTANRSSDLSILYVVIHDTEGGCAASLNWLDNPRSRASAHFLVCQDGTVYQMVHIHDIAWHAGNWYVNQHSIGIEHEGYRDSGGYTQAQYDVSAAILQWLDNTYHLGLALDRNSVFGHENVPNANHTDPGPSWDWTYFMSKVRGGAAFDGGDPTVAMVAAPQTTLYACPDPSCTLMGTANWGEQFAVAGASGGWDQIYYNGAAAWISGGAITNGRGTRLRVVAPSATVRDEASGDGMAIGTIPQGQVYVSRLLDTSVDAAGWWLIAFNHRYAFLSASAVQALTPAPLIPTATAPAIVATATPIRLTPTATFSSTTTAPVTLTASCVARTAIATPTGTLSPTISMTATATLNPTMTATPSSTATGTATSTATSTATDTASATTAALTAAATDDPTPSATATATATPSDTATPTPSATATATVTPSSTATATATPTCTPQRLTRISVRPSRLQRSSADASRRVAGPLRLRALTVRVLRSNVAVGNPFRLQVHTNVGRAALQYRISLPGGSALRATGHTDRQGNARQAFIMPQRPWLARVLRRRGHVVAVLPHSLQAGYRVVVSWRHHTITRRGTFRIVLWGRA